MWTKFSIPASKPKNISKITFTFCIIFEGKITDIFSFTKLYIAIHNSQTFYASALLLFSSYIARWIYIVTPFQYLGSESGASHINKFEENIKRIIPCFAVRAQEDSFINTKKVHLSLGGLFYLAGM